MSDIELKQYIPKEIGRIRNHQTAIPHIAKNKKQISVIDAAIQDVPTTHDLHIGDARKLESIPDGSVHLVLTSPPYWTLKEYRKSVGQMGSIKSYDKFLDELRTVWEQCFRVLSPGGRLVCVVGDVCLSRRKNKGRHTVVPLHASIQEMCREIGFDNLAPIIWSKISNAAYESDRGSGGFLGKPYEPNAVIKNDIEYILMQRKPGAYRSPTVFARILSVISEENHRKWFRQIWSDLPGASTKNHPAPFPLDLTNRLIKMFSFVGDTILDPFMGTGTTNLGAANSGRNSIGIEIDPHYFRQAFSRLESETSGLFSNAEVRKHKPKRTTGK